MSQSKHYTAQEIERYHRGQLSMAEMHALEKAALDDPFLADALEGFRHTPTPAKDLSALQQKLQLRLEKEEERKRVFFWNTSWMKVAALFVLFAGGGWLVFQLLSKNLNTDQNEVATTQQAKPHTTQGMESSADSSSEIVADAPSVSAPTTTYKHPIETDKSARENVARNRSTAETKELAPYSSPQPKQELQDEVKRLQEVTALRQSTADSMAMEAMAMMKEKDNAKGVLVDTIRNLTVVMKPTQLPAEEVVVVNSKSTPQAKRRMQVVIDTLEPAAGWTNFDDYIASNLKAPEEFKLKPIKGEVELMFDVNKQGQPINITVVKSLCEKCDEEAIRLLKEGPKWKQSRKKGKVRIRF